MFNREDIAIRRVQFSDLAVLFKWENNKNFWQISDRKEPLSRNEIEAFINDQQQPVFDLDQLRFMVIEKNTQKAIGTVDLYEIDWQQNSAFIGILIVGEAYRRRSAATYAIDLIEEFALNQLELDKVIARIQPENQASLALFENRGYLKKNTVEDDNVEDAVYLHYFTFEKWLKK